MWAMFPPIYTSAMADSLAHASMETHCITLPNERLMSSNETLPGEQSSTKPEIDVALNGY